MSTDDTLCFADHDVVTGAPTVDGFTGIHDDLVITHESDAGYVLGSRLTFGSSSGFPPVIFQGVKNGNFLNFAFFCRFDMSFDLEDVVVIAMRPQVSITTQTTARRIDIFPVYEAAGADEKNTTTGGPAGALDDHPPGVPTGVDYHIRTNHAAQNVRHYRGQASGDQWTTFSPGATLTTSSGAQTFPTGTFNVASTTGFPSSGRFAVSGIIVDYTGKTVTSFTGCSGGGSLTVPAGSAVSIAVLYNPSNITVKTRSWQPPVPNTTSVGAQTLPTTLPFNVMSTVGFPGTGFFAVAGQIVTYTGTTPTSFSGCTGGSGLIPAGSPVSKPECAWSIEVQLPLTTVLGGLDWIDILDSFGMYFAVIRVGKTPASGGTISQGWFSTQFLFPVGTGNFLAGVLDETMNINPAWYGTGLIPALQTPPGSNLGLGVHFVGGELGVGVRNTSDLPGSAIGNMILGAGSTAAGNNRLVAKVENTGAAAANNVSAEFRFANWGLPAATFPSWALASGATADQPTGVTVGTTGSTEITWTWLKALVPTDYAPPHDHQCVWVQLSSTTGVNFNQSSVRRNMDFGLVMSESARPATISGVGYKKPTGGSHDFLLKVNVRRLVQIPLTQGDQTQGNLLRMASEPSGNTGGRAGPTVGPKQTAGGNTVLWLWVVHGYRRTGKTITIRRRAFEILDEAPGAFGSFARHEGLQDVFSYDLSGGGIQNLGGDFFALKVPHNGSVEIKTRIAAGPVVPPVPGRCDDLPGDSMLVRLLKALCRLALMIRRP